MDDVRALLILLPDAPLPDPASVEHADALVFVPPDDEEQYGAAAERVTALLELGPPVYLVIPLLESGQARPYLAQTLRQGVYGVASRAPGSVDQLRYLEGVLEELELRLDIQPGLTAMAVGFDHPRALNLMSDALAAMRESSDRMTWIAFNHAEFAETLGVPADSPTVAVASADVVLTAAAFDLPVVYGAPSDAEHAARLGFRGCATDDAADLQRLQTLLSQPESESAENEENS